MARVADHLSGAEPERRFRACPDPVEARHVQVIWPLDTGPDGRGNVEGHRFRVALDRATAGARQRIQTRNPGQRAAAQRPQAEPADGRGALAPGGRAYRHKLVPTLDAIVETTGARCCDLAERQSDISSRASFSRWLKRTTPA